MGRKGNLRLLFETELKFLAKLLPGSGKSLPEKARAQNKHPGHNSQKELASQQAFENEKKSARNAAADGTRRSKSDRQQNLTTQDRLSKPYNSSGTENTENTTHRQKTDKQARTNGPLAEKAARREQAARKTSLPPTGSRQSGVPSPRSSGKPFKKASLNARTAKLPKKTSKPKLNKLKTSKSSDVLAQGQLLAKPTSDLNQGLKPKLRRMKYVHFSLSLLAHSLLFAFIFPIGIWPQPEIELSSKRGQIIRLVPSLLSPSNRPPDPKEAEAKLDAPIEKKEEKPEDKTPVDDLPKKPVEKITKTEEPVPETPNTTDSKTEDDKLMGLAGPSESTPESNQEQASSSSNSNTSGLGSRGDGKELALKKHGGAAQTEIAVSAGLAWLAEHQDKSGAWSPTYFSKHCGAGRPCTGAGINDYKVGVTALACLAFLGAGSTEESGLYSEVVESSLSYLLKSQDSGNGCFGPQKGNYMYNHAIAVFCMAEAYLVTANKKYKLAVEKGLQFSHECQQAGGGWDYTAIRTGRSDLSITGWQVMAMNSAKQGFISYNPRMESATRNFIRRSVKRNGVGIYADNGMGQGRTGVAMVAVGALCKLYLDWSPRSREIQLAAKRILKMPPDPEGRIHWKKNFQSTYYWYYATLSMFHVGGDAWEAWNTFLKRRLLPLQCNSFHNKGSWDPDPNWIGATGGRVASTALCVLMFETYYRYRPLHEKFGKQRKNKSR